MRRTSFMTRLEGGRFQYKDDLGGLCMTCNECGYLIFDEIENIIEMNIMDSGIRVNNYYIKIIKLINANNFYITNSLSNMNNK